MTVRRGGAMFACQCLDCSGFVSGRDEHGDCGGRDDESRGAGPFVMPPAQKGKINK